MYIRAFDYLSPNITLYYKGELRHRSVVSGILTIIAYGVVLAVAIVFILQLFDKTSPTAYYSNRFIADAGSFPMMWKNMFHYYEMLDFGSVPNKDWVRFFRITAKTNIDGPDYWLYDYCKEEDYGDLLKEESYAEDIPVIKEKLCIRYYWDDANKRFIKSDDPSFTYPTILHGISHPDYNYYQANLNKCINGTEQDEVLGPCGPAEEIAGFNSYHVLALVIIDNDIDVDNYEKPINPIKYKFWSMKLYGSYLVNQLNIDPVLVKTHKGLIFDKVEEQNAVVYAADGRSTTNEEIDMMHQYNVYVMNRQLVYDRSYKKLPEVLANVGGMTQVIVNVAFVINLLINRFCLFLDCEV
ncbi:MAG: hypothetical protein MJ252_22265, partial [archaeon]|nr:hypothetical protein [archaeon]